ncbi:hypothetical protein G9A89_015909 [Geosiphon pyriformis]|nr:hypothetical protein G9A89_015909 [Geosiphon pyriformis]
MVLSRSLHLQHAGKESCLLLKRTLGQKARQEPVANARRRWYLQPQVTSQGVSQPLSEAAIEAVDDFSLILW